MHGHPVAANVCTKVTGIHHADLVTVGHGVAVESFVGEPVVQRAHPSGAAAAIKFGKAVNLADIACLCTGLGIAAQRIYDAAHSGGFLVDLDPFIHQRPRPCRALSVNCCCERGVFHDHMYCLTVCPHGGGDQAEYHHQCQQQ